MLRRGSSHLPQPLVCCARQFSHAPVMLPLPVQGPHLPRDFIGRDPGVLSPDESCVPSGDRLQSSELCRVQVPTQPGVAAESLQPYVTYEAAAKKRARCATAGFGAPSSPGPWAQGPLHPKRQRTQRHLRGQRQTSLLLARAEGGPRSCVWTERRMPGGWSCAWTATSAGRVVPKSLRPLGADARSRRRWVQNAGGLHFLVFDASMPAAGDSEDVFVPSWSGELRCPSTES